MAGSSILGLLSTASRERLVAAGSALTLEPGRQLCQRGDPGDAIFVVLEGEIEIRISSTEGREIRFASFGPGAVVGEMAVLDGGLRSTDMLAARRSRLWRIPREPLIQALRGDSAACVALVVELARRLRVANAELEATRILNLGGRLAQLLLVDAAEKALVSLTQTEIARRLGASREKVNRKLNAWARQGWVALGTSGVRLLDKSALAGEMQEKGAS
jgi:CRP/FNR family cyclic AMP-dependent transcriptional regulator